MTFIEKKINKLLIGMVLGGSISGVGKSSSQSILSLGILSKRFLSIKDFLYLGVREIFKLNKKKIK